MHAPELEGGRHAARAVEIGPVAVGVVSFEPVVEELSPPAQCGVLSGRWQCDVGVVRDVRDLDAQIGPVRVQPRRGGSIGLRG